MLRLNLSEFNRDYIILFIDVHFHDTISPNSRYLSPIIIKYRTSSVSQSTQIDSCDAILYLQQNGALMRSISHQYNVLESISSLCTARALSLSLSDFSLFLSSCLCASSSSCALPRTAGETVRLRRRVPRLGRENSYVQIVCASFRGDRIRRGHMESCRTRCIHPRNFWRVENGGGRGKAGCDRQEEGKGSWGGMKTHIYPSNGVDDLMARSRYDKEIVNQFGEFTSFSGRM